jgi:hypothetical protein
MQAETDQMQAVATDTDQVVVAEALARQVEQLMVAAVLEVAELG